MAQVDLNIGGGALNLHLRLLLILTPLIGGHHEQPAPFLLLDRDVQFNRAVLDDREHDIVLLIDFGRR